MPRLALYLLGPPRIERDGVPLKLQYRKNTALIAYLAVTGERHTREALITLLWPEHDPSRARASLRRDLSVLRRLLGEEVLVVDRETVGLDPRGDPSPPAEDQALWLDVNRFRHLLSAWRGHGHPEAEVCPQCLADLAEAVAGSGLPIRPIQDIKAEVEDICGGPPAAPKLAEKVVAAVKWVDGTVLDCVCQAAHP